MQEIQSLKFRRGMDQNSFTIVFNINGQEIDSGFVQCYPGQLPKVIFWGDHMNGQSIPTGILDQISAKGKEMHYKRIIS